MESYISDLTLALLKSTPSNLVLDETNEELIKRNSYLFESSFTNPCEVRLFHQSTFDRTWQYLYGKADPSIMLVPGECVTVRFLFGLADLIQHPDEFNYEKMKYHINPIDISKEFDILQREGMTNDDNKFVDQIVSCRALYNWLLPKSVPLSDVTIKRDTGTSLPPGKYVFRVKCFMFDRLYERVNSETKRRILGDKYNRWYDLDAIKHYGQICWTPETKSQFSVIQDDLNVTVEISKQNWHGKNGSVETNHSRGKKEKSSNGKESPSPHMAVER